MCNGYKNGFTAEDEDGDGQDDANAMDVDAVGPSASPDPAEAATKKQRWLQECLFVILGAEPAGNGAW